MMNDIIFNVLKVIVVICTVLIVKNLIPYLKCRIQSATNEELYTMIDVAVRAAEQTVKGSGMGPLKKENVIIFLSNWLNENGIEISDKQLSELIEAAVFNMNHE